jgi:hypothetical protein
MGRAGRRHGALPRCGALPGCASRRQGCSFQRKPANSRADLAAAPPLPPPGGGPRRGQGADARALRPNPDRHPDLHGARGEGRGREPGLGRRAAAPAPAPRGGLSEATRRCAATRRAPIPRAAYLPVTAHLRALQPPARPQNPKTPNPNPNLNPPTPQPQVWRGLPYGYSSDLWSLGCVLYELMSYRCAGHARPRLAARGGKKDGSPCPTHAHCACGHAQRGCSSM